MHKLKVMCFFATQKGYEVLSAMVNSNQTEKIGCVVTFKEKAALSFENNLNP